MKYEAKCSFEALSIENAVVQQISRDGEFHSRTAVKIKLTALCALLACGISANAQPVLAGGFTGMAKVDGGTYTKTGVAGDPAGGYAFVAASHDRTTFFASSSSKHHIYFINPSTYDITDSLAHTVYYITATNEPNTLFARTDSGLCRINTLTKTITDSVNIADAFHVAERPNSKEVWVGANNKVVVVDYTSGLNATPFTYSGVATDNGDIRFTAGGTIAYKLAWTSEKLYKINAATKIVMDSLTCSSSPGNLEVSRDSSKVFITFPGDKKIRIYATSSMTIIDSIDCGTREPFDIYNHPTRNEIWVVNHFKDSVTVFNDATYAQIAALPVTGSPHALAFSLGTTAAGNINTTAATIAAYPNPVSNSITVTGIIAGDNIRAYDVAGHELFTIIVTGTQQTFDISSLGTGIYIMQVLSKEGNRKASLSITKL